MKYDVPADVLDCDAVARVRSAHGTRLLPCAYAACAFLSLRLVELLSETSLYCLSRWPTAAMNCLN